MSKAPRYRNIPLGGIPASFLLVLSAGAARDVRRDYGFEVPEYPDSVAQAQLTRFPSKGFGVLLVLQIRKAAIKESTPYQLAGLVAHEAVHLMQTAKEAMREATAGEEFEAYLVQYVVMEVLSAIATEIQSRSSIPLK